MKAGVRYTSALAILVVCTARAKQEFAALNRFTSPHAMRGQRNGCYARSWPLLPADRPNAGGS